MGKAVANSVLDAALAKIATSNNMHLCPSEPTDRANAIAISLGSVVPTFQAASDDTSGRKVDVDAKTVTPTGDGSVTHIALVDATELLYVTTTTSTGVTTGVDVDVATWKANIQDPT